VACANGSMGSFARQLCPAARLGDRQESDMLSKTDSLWIVRAEKREGEHAEGWGARDGSACGWRMVFSRSEGLEGARRVVGLVLSTSTSPTWATKRSEMLRWQQD
jgi:hypothetical protein